MTTPEDEITYVQEPGDLEPRKVRVIDLIDPRAERADSQVRSDRMLACRDCEHFQFGVVCGDCGCVMTLKTWLKDATCPLGKW